MGRLSYTYITFFVDDWEEAHEKLSELIIEKSNLSGNSVFNDSLLENDESQDVSK